MFNARFILQKSFIFGIIDETILLTAGNRLKGKLMNVTLICANTLRAAKTAIDDKLKSLDPTDLDFTNYVIVPDRSTLDAEKALLKHVGGSFNTQVVTFKNLAKRFVAGSALTYLNKQNGILLLSGLAFENADKLTCFSKSYDTDGFADKVYEVVSALKYARINPQELAADDLPSSLKNKLEDVRLLYAAYVEATKDRFYDSADTLERLTDCLTAERIGNCRFYLYDFLSFTAQEKAVLARLVTNGKSVTVATVADDRANRASVIDNAVALAVKEVCGAVGCEFKKEFFTDHASFFTKKLSSALFFNSPIRAVDLPDGTVTVVSSPSIDEECLALAKFVRNYVREGGLYKDVKVVCSDVSQYAYALNRRFGDYSVPFYLDEKTSLDKTVAAEYLTSFLDCHLANFDIEKILRFAKNPLFETNVSAFETFAREYNVNFNYDEFDIGKENAFFAEADATRAKIKEFVCDVTVPKAARAADYVEILKKIVVEHDIVKKTETYSERLKGYGYQREAEILSQAQAKIDEVLGQVTEIFGNTEMDLKRFIVGLTSSLASQTISVLPTKNDCVFVSNLDKGKDHDVKVLAVLGANESELPKVYKNCALLSDKNIEDLSKRGLSVEISLEQKNRQEKFSLFNLLCEPVDKLYVSYKTKNGKEEVRPSAFVSVVKKCFNVKESLPVFAEDKKTVLNKAILARTALKEGKAIDADRKVCFKLMGEEAKVYDVFESEVKEVENGEKLFFKGDEFSVTRIERFFECPFKHFLADGLKLKEQKTADFNAADFGNVLHEVFDRFVTRLKSHPDAQPCDAEVIFDSVMQEERNRAFLRTAKGKAVIARLRKEAVFHCGNIKREIENGEFRPLRTEFEFCKKDGTAPKFVVDGKEYFLKGFIDRVDVTEDGKAVVYDYKTGNPRFTEKLLYGGLKLQLYTYASAVKGLNYEPIGCFYYRVSNSAVGKQQKLIGRAVNDIATLKRIDGTVRDGEKSDFLGVSLTKAGEINAQQKVWITEEEFEACRVYAEKIITEACRLMRRGYISVTPVSSACDYCRGKGVCGQLDTRIKTERTFADVKTKDFLSMTEEG